MTQINPDGSVTTRFELTPEEQKALAYARDHNVLLVVSAGNQGESMSALGRAAQEFDNILTVGAAAGADRANYSSYGEGLSLLAPDRIQGGGQAGTSLATARVTGTVAQIWSANPELSVNQVIQALESTATDLNTPGWDAETGFGVLNRSAAIDWAEQVIPEPQVVSNPQGIPNGSQGDQTKRSDELLGDESTWSSLDGVTPSERPNRLLEGSGSGLESASVTNSLSTASSSNDLLKYEPGTPLQYNGRVRQWQQRMEERGYDIKVDGFYGSQSEQVARQFQREQGLAVDGVVGSETWAATFNPNTTSPSTEPEPNPPPFDPRKVDPQLLRAEGLTVSDLVSPDPPPHKTHPQIPEGSTRRGELSNDSPLPLNPREVDPQLLRSEGLTVSDLVSSQVTDSSPQDDSSRIAERESFEDYPDVEQSTSWAIPWLRPADDPNTNKTTTAENGVEVGLASQRGYEVVYLQGRLLEQIKADPDMIEQEAEIIEEIQDDPRYGSESFYVSGKELVGFGGQRWTSPEESWIAPNRHNPLLHLSTYQVATNELTWVLRNATVEYWAEVTPQGEINIEYRLNDRLDLSPAEGRQPAYNAVSTVLGFGYHDLAGGNRNLQIRAEWNTTVEADHDITDGSNGFGDGRSDGDSLISDDGEIFDDDSLDGDNFGGSSFIDDSVSSTFSRQPDPSDPSLNVYFPYNSTAELRYLPGIATGGERLPDITGRWFEDGRIGLIPGQIARRMQGLDFNNFREFRETFWKFVAQDPHLGVLQSDQNPVGWSSTNLNRMRRGLAPFVESDQATGAGSNAVYQLDHSHDLQYGGEVYDLDSIRVVTPRFHQEYGRTPDE